MCEIYVQHIRYTDGSQNICFCGFYGCNIKLEKALVVFCHFLRDGEKVSISLTHHACVISSNVFCWMKNIKSTTAVFVFRFFVENFVWAPVDPDYLVKKGGWKNYPVFIPGLFHGRHDFSGSCHSHQSGELMASCTQGFWDSKSWPVKGCLAGYPSMGTGWGNFSQGDLRLCLFKGNLEDHPMTCMWIITMVIVSPLYLGCGTPSKWPKLLINRGLLTTY